MTLDDFLTTYISCREIRESSVGQYMVAVRQFSRCIGRPLEVAELSAQLVNQHIQCCRRRGLADETRKSRLRHLMTLWRAAADYGLAAEPPRRQIVQVRVRDRLPTAWTCEEVRRLLDAAQSLRGTLRHGIGRAGYWSSYVRAAWDTGLRGCDLRALPTAVVRAGAIGLIQVKTRRRKRIALRPATIEAIRATYPPDRPLVWPLWGRLERWRKEARQLVRLAGLTGSIGRLRHSSGTAFEAAHRGRGHEHLGNTRAVFEAHYFDQDLVGGDQVELPPEL